MSYHLNTNSSCFLCLTSINISSSENRFSSLNKVFEYLKISSEEIARASISQATISGDINTNLNDKTIIKCQLCDDCKEKLDQLLSSILKLEKIQLEVDKDLKSVQGKIVEGNRDEELVENYNRRMTSDAESITQVDFIEKLRIEILNNSVKTSVPGEAPPPIKTDSEDLFKEEFVDSNEAYLEDNDNFFEETEESTNGNCIVSSEPKNLFLFEENVVNDTESSAINPSEFLESSSTNQQNVTTFKCAINKETGQYDCTACSKSFKTRCGAGHHYNSHHLPKTCRFCNETGFSSFSELKYHQKFCTQLKEQPPSVAGTSSIKIGQVPASSSKSFFNISTNNYNCSICHREFGSRQATAQHYDSIHLQKSFECDICNSATFKNRRSLMCHRKNCAKITEQANSVDISLLKAKCPYCDQRFKNYSSLSFHKEKIHFLGTPKTCTICNKNFPGKCAYNNHKKYCKS